MTVGKTNKKAAKPAAKAGKKLKAAILGFGGMGHCHAAQYAAQKEVELVALCDINPKQFEKDSMQINFGGSGKTDVKKMHTYLSYEELIKNEPDLDYIDICLPTNLHTEYSIRAMQDGFHVLCEKPMALNTKDADKMIAVSHKTGKFLMIAQCVRFDENFQEVKKAYASGKYGKLLRISMHRCGSFPGGWFRDVKLSGGALMDLHIHDIDFIQYLLGNPSALSCHGAIIKSGGYDDIMVDMDYADGVRISAESSWARASWSCGLAAMFENATVQINNGVSIYEMDKPVKQIKLPGKGNAYFLEIADFAHCVKTKKRPAVASMESTRETIRLIEKEIQSAKQDGRKVRV